MLLARVRGAKSTCWRREARRHIRPPLCFHTQKRNAPTKQREELRRGGRCQTSAIASEGERGCSKRRSANGFCISTSMGRYSDWRTFAEKANFDGHDAMVKECERIVDT